MSVRSFQQIADEAERLKPYKARYVGLDDELSGFTPGKVYEVKDDVDNSKFDMHYVELVDDDGYDRFRPSDEFEKIPDLRGCNPIGLTPDLKEVQAWQFNHL
jgi:hypothetical protein